MTDTGIFKHIWRINAVLFLVGYALLLRLPNKGLPIGKGGVCSMGSPLA